MGDDRLRHRRLYSLLQRTDIVWKMAAATALSWEAARLVGSKHPYLAPITVILVIQTTIIGSWHHAYQRVLGTIIGVVLTASVARYVGIHGWSIVLLILMGTGAAKLFRLKEPVIHQIALSTVLVLMFENHSTSYAWDRILDTIIGAVAGLLIQFVVPPDLTNKAAQAVARLAAKLAATFGDASRWLDEPGLSGASPTWRQSMHNLLEELHATDRAIHKAQKSLRFNPAGKRSRLVLSNIKKHLARIRAGIDRLTILVQALEDQNLRGTAAQDDRHVWVNTMRNLGDRVDQWILFQPELRVRSSPFAQFLPVPDENRVSSGSVSDFSFHQIVERESEQIARLFEAVPRLDDSL